MMCLDIFIMFLLFVLTQNNVKLFEEKEVNSQFYW